MIIVTNTTIYNGNNGEQIAGDIYVVLPTDSKYGNKEPIHMHIRS